VTDRRTSVEDRERAIFRYLADVGNGGATARDIWETVGQKLADSVTPQAYYKVLDRLVAVGKLDVLDDDPAGGRRYAVTPYLHVDTALTLDDVYELLDWMEPTEAIARVVDARDYFEEKRADTLAAAARALLEEDPRELVFAFVAQRFRELQTDVEMYRDKELAERDLLSRIQVQFKEFQVLVYRWLGLSRSAVDAAHRDSIISGDADLLLDEAVLRRELDARIFGDRCIMPIDAKKVLASDEWKRTSVSGSDGSTHASVMQVVTASHFVEDAGHQVVTFNNSVVYIEPAPSIKDRISFPYYSVPMTRSAIDDATNRGMVLAPFMFRYLSDSEYQHMAHCATDVVQWRADEAVFLGTGRSWADGTLLPKPTIHIRDGTIVPEEREYKHYRTANPYGDMVREGIGHSRKILERIVSTDTPPVFAGAVKSTRVRFFSSLLNWYISIGSRSRLGEPIDPQWDTTRAAHIADNEAMSYLLSTLEGERRDGLYYVTFGVVRTFHTFTEYFARPKDDSFDWVDFFEQIREREATAYRDDIDPDPPYLASVPDVADDDFVFLTRKADYVSFYIGHTGSEPPPVAPRYEFLESLRSMPTLEAKRARVRRNQELLVGGIHRTGLSADTEHNFLSQKRLVKLIPFVVYEAHEKCKALGKKLESELKSFVIAHLQALRRARAPRPSDVEFRPAPLRTFIEQRRIVQEDREDREEDVGRNER
jgi:hypothetical protein